MGSKPIRVVNIHEAKTHLSRLVDEGRPFVIAKAGKPKMKVVLLDEPAMTAKNRIGFMKGMFTIPEDFEQIDRNWIRILRTYFTARRKDVIPSRYTIPALDTHR